MDSERSEYLLRLLSKAASLCESDREATLLLLRESQAHLWRLSPTESFCSALALERKLSQPLEHWLPESVRLGYSGPLLASERINFCSMPAFKKYYSKPELVVRESW